MEPITDQIYKQISKEIQQGHVGVNSRYFLEGFGELSILHIAIYLEDYKMINYLLDNHVDLTVNEPSCGTALHLAVTEKLKFTVVFRILDAGADVNVQDSKGYTPLHLAVMKNRPKAAKMLLDFGANVDLKRLPTRTIDFWTPLDIAIIENKLEFVELFLDSDIDCKFKENYCPLVIASLYGTIHGIEMLIRKGADVNYCKDSGLITETPLQAAVISGDRNKVKHLLRNIHLEVNKKNLEGETALHYAMDSPSDSSLQYLLDARADVNLVNGRGKLPIQVNNRESGVSKRLVLKKHLVKLQVAGIKLADENVKAIAGEMKDWRKECEEELELLKKTFVEGSNFSLFTVIFRNVHWLAKRLTRVDEGNILNSNIREVFPIYGNMIHYNFKIAANRKQLLICVERAIYDVLYYLLPDTFIRCISSYLTNKDLEIMNVDKSAYTQWV